MERAGRAAFRWRSDSLCNRRLDNRPSSKEVVTSFDLPSQPTNLKNKQAVLHYICDRLRRLAVVAGPTMAIYRLRRQLTAPAAASPTNASGVKLQVSRLDLFLHHFRPWARLIAVAIPYYVIGAAVYHLLETKHCEKPALPQGGCGCGASFTVRAEDKVKCREPWSMIDGLYFTTVSMSTVGYGDLSCSTNLSRAFTGLWIIIGVLVVFVEIVSCFSGFIAALNATTSRIVDWVLMRESTLKVDFTSSEAPPPASLVYFYFNNLWVPLLWYLLFQLGIALLIMWSDSWMDGWDILWYCFVTATTVGYGDVNVTTQQSRFLATFHVLLSVIWLAALFGHVQGLNVVRRQQIAHHQMLQRRLDAEMIANMDHDGLGVDQIEFLVETLLHLGCEIGGEPLSWKHITPILLQFQALYACRGLNPGLALPISLLTSPAFEPLCGQ